MNKVNNDAIPHLNILNQYIKDLSYENLQKKVGQKANIKENDTSVDIKVIYKPYDENHFEVLIKITIICNSKKDRTIIFQLELEYLGFFKIENMKSFNKDRLSSEGAKIIFPFARSIIATITQNGGYIPIVLDNVDFSLIKS